MSHDQSERVVKEIQEPEFYSTRRVEIDETRHDDSLDVRVKGISEEYHIDFPYELTLPFEYEQPPFDSERHQDELKLVVLRDFPMDVNIFGLYEDVQAVYSCRHKNFTISKANDNSVGEVVEALPEHKILWRENTQ